jgi:cell division septation protein DedD
VPAPVDSEASQTGVANPQIGAAADGLNGAPAGNGSDDSDQSNTGSNDMGGGQNTAPQNNGSGADGYNAASPYASGKSVAIPKPAPTAQTFGSAVYRIQAGAFQSQANAKTLEDALRHKGYAATTMPRQSNGATSYVVQVGAYSSRVTADETVASLQHDGFPASVSVGQ